MSSAMRKLSREVSVNGFLSASAGANAAPCTRKSRPPNSRSSVGAEVRDLLIVADVARQDERVVERRRQLADVFFEPLAGIGQREARARGRRRLRDRPRDRSLVRDADDETVLSGEIRHG